MVTEKPAKFSKKEVLKFGFEKAKQNWQFFVPVLIINWFINHGSDFIPELNAWTGQFPVMAIIIYIVIWILQMVMGLGLTKIALEFADNKKPRLTDLFYLPNQFGSKTTLAHYKPLISYTLATLLYTLIVLVGLVLLIVPGIILGIRLQFYGYLIIDKGMGPIEALKKSWQMTKGVTWEMFLLGILVLLIDILGLLALIVGLFISIPTGMIATARVYKKLIS